MEPITDTTTTTPAGTTRKALLVRWAAATALLAVAATLGWITRPDHPTTSAAVEVDAGWHDTGRDADGSSDRRRPRADDAGGPSHTDLTDDGGEVCRGNGAPLPTSPESWERVVLDEPIAASIAVPAGWHHEPTDDGGLLVKDRAELPTLVAKLYTNPVEQSGDALWAFARFDLELQFDAPVVASRVTTAGGHPACQLRIDASAFGDVHAEEVVVDFGGRDAQIYLIAEGPGRNNLDTLYAIAGSVRLEHNTTGT